VSVPPPDEISALAPMPRNWVVEEFRPHEPEIRGYLQARFPAVDADDIVQESYLKLLKLRAAEKIESARSYFFSVARNTAVSLFRRQKIYSDIPVADLPPELLAADADDASETAYTQQRLELVIRAIDRLPARCREVMRLSAIEGQSTAAIAQALGLAESTVRVQLVRGVHRCRQFMDECGERK
jgi:RNA polymerase sigma-70 factor (ECF subfamily)